jgi:aminopeptidase N
MKDNLTREEARGRSALIDGVSTDVFLDLTGKDDFRSESVLRFRCLEPGSTSFLDLSVEALHRVEVNGRGLDETAYDGHRIHLPPLEEENEVRVEASCGYRSEGQGMMRFEDAADGEAYAYSDLEPFGAHRAFACFDQPDLKGPVRTSVLVPEGWEVAANAGPAGDPEPTEAGMLWRFEETPPLPSYLVALVAGPWHVIRDEHRGIPLGILCRRSLAEHLDPDEIFEVTKQGLDFFEDAFGYPYAFGKYDQVFVPEFLAGAMENPGCVTFNEIYIFRSRVTEARRERRAGTILHEMAHMWFGDLVTMRWWDDLWLNETFASFAGELATERATRFTEAWTTFAHTEKAWATRQDQLPTTHPVVADVPDVESVFLNFDGITYAKGASVIRQLVAWVGLDRFLEGMRRYFRRHEFGNASLADFLAALEEASGRDLQGWADAWLRTSGVNSLRPEVETDDDRIASLSVIQEAPQGTPLRTHRSAVGLFGREGGALRRLRRIECDLEGALNDVPEVAGEPVPDLVLVNDDDFTFAKVGFDERSLETVLSSLSDLEGSLSRAVCWRALWDLTRDGSLPARRYLRVVLDHVGVEDNPASVQRLLGQAESAVWQYGDPANRDATSGELAATARRMMREAEPGSDLQLIWARTFISSARSDEDLRMVRGMLDGSVAVEGLAVDTDLRWHAVRSLVASGVGEELIDAELARDRTDQGRREAAAARAARPLDEAKEEAWRRILHPDGAPLALIESVMAGFQQPGQEHLLRPYVPRYFEALEEVWSVRDRVAAIAFAEQMFPRHLVEDDTLELTDAALGREDLPGPLRRVLLEGRDGVRRARRVRAADRG